MKKYVQIHSMQNVRVTCGLQSQNVTDNTVATPNRLNVLPLWQDNTCMIRQGRHWYPAIITTWFTVKCLVKDGICTIGEFSDDIDDKEVIAQTAEMTAKQEVIESNDTTANAIRRDGKKVKKVEDINLEALSEESDK